MTRDDVFKVLGTVNYPGFSRDIVSFGMVSEVVVDEAGLRIVLSVATKNEDQKEKLKTVVEQAVTERLPVKEVAIDIIEPQAKKNGKTEATAKGESATRRSPIPGVRYTIAVASGKGGVGKSTVAVNTAAALMQMGAKVGILDLDIYGPSVPMILGVNEQPHLNADQKIVPLKRHGMDIMSFGFISGNKTPTIWRGPLVARMTQQFFDDVAWQDLDFLILDLPPGTGDIQLTLVQHLALTGAIVVTTPQNLALLDVRKGADMFRKVNTPVLGVVENMSGLLLSGTVKTKAGDLLAEARIEYSDIGEANAVTTDEKGRFTLDIPIFRRGGGEVESRRLNVPLLARIPLVPDVVLASDGGEPYVLSHPDSVAGQAFQAIAMQITRFTKTLTKAD